MKRVKQVENDGSGAAVVLLIGSIGVTAALLAWRRSRETVPAVSFPFARSQPVSQYVDFIKPRPQFGYSDRRTFGFAF